MLSAQEQQLVQSLLVYWEEQREQGRSLSARQLCKGHPELIDQVEALIEDLRQFEFTASRSSTRFSSRDSLRTMLSTALRGDFELEAMLGRGGMGVVYRARDLGLDRSVAVKWLHHASTMKRFRKEAKILARISSPHVVTIYGFREWDGGGILIMEFLERGSLLDEMSASGGTITEPRALALMQDVAKGMLAAANKEIVHRDLKPANILLDGNGQAKVADFGIATSMSGSLATTSYGVTGTLWYMAPEQFNNPESVDTRTDIYGFGATFYHALVGRPVFDGVSSFDLHRKHLLEQPIPAIEAAGGVSPPISKLLQKCLEKSPGDRFRGFDEVLACLKKPKPRVVGRTSGPKLPPAAARPASRRAAATRDSAGGRTASPSPTARLWVYKCNVRSGAEGEWDYFFGQLGGHGQWGGSWGIKHPGSLKILREQLRAGDLVLAWQSDKQAAYGLCRVVDLSRDDQGEILIVLESVTRFDPPVKLLDYRDQTPKLTAGTVFAKGRSGTLFGTSPDEAREILRICGVPTTKRPAPKKSAPKQRPALNGSPTVKELVAAFRAIQSTVSQGQLAMLRAHYHRGTVTMPELAEAAGYQKWNGANLQYGLMAQKLCDQLRFRPRMTLKSTGQPVWTAVIGENPDWEAGISAGQWRWTMYPQVRQALEKLGWV